MISEDSPPIEPVLVSRRSFVIGALGLVGAWGTTAGAARNNAARRRLGKHGVFLVEDFRQHRDADDTSCIRRAIAVAHAAGGGRVYASPGRVYRVSPQTTFDALNPSGGRAKYRVCVQLPPRVRLDMRGSTLRLLGSAEATIVSNTNLSGGGRRDTDLGLLNAVLDGRHVPFTGTSLLHLAYVDRLALRGIKIVRGVYQGGWIYSCSASVFDDLDADGFLGQPWTIGSPLGSGNQIYDSMFGRLRARNVAKIDNAFLEGNSFDLVLTRCHVQSIEASKCAAAIKLQWPSTDVTVDSVTTDTCGDPNGNSGLKIQGDAARGPVTRATVGKVVARNQTGMGLYMERCVDCSVDSYSGFGNNKNGNRADVWIGGTSDYIGRLYSDASGGAGVIVRPYATGYQLPVVRVRNPGQVSGATNKAGVAVFGGSGVFGRVICIDNQRHATMNRGVDVNSPNAVGKIGSLAVTGQREMPFKSVSPSFPAPIPH